ncbi:hypothetical protein [Amycolatopsis sp. NBC_00438]|uniref:hypothetical protein n=1 Tax=Amycolatopsis sp. NBC_00438 TaxID=2903558 RepID=UPI002E1A3ADD
MTGGRRLGDPGAHLPVVTPPEAIDTAGTANAIFFPKQPGNVSRSRAAVPAGLVTGAGEAESDAAFDRIDFDGSLTVDEFVVAVRAYRYGRLDVPLPG